MGPPEAKEQPGSSLVSDLEIALGSVSANLFGGEWADARLISCTMANLAVYHAFGNRGCILVPAPGDGGHFSQVAGGTPSIAGMNGRELPFDSQAQMLDDEAAARLVAVTRPTIIMLGRSVILRPDVIDGVVRAARQVGARTVYDASHVAGLIAGGVFPNPLDAGVDLMTMSTYKTLGGPPGAIIVGRDAADACTIRRVIDSGLLANQAAARYPALLSALLLLRDGSDEPSRVIANTAALKASLVEHDVEVLAQEHPAATHQVVIPTGSLDETVTKMKLLETAGILVGRCPVPGHPGRYGLRFGTQYATRIGLDEHAMQDAASIIAPLLRARILPPRALAEIASAIVAMLARLPADEAPGP